MGGAAVALVVLAGSALTFRNDVVRILPGAAPLYTAIGMPVNRLGLVIEALRAEPALQDGHAALAVSGVIRNIEGRSIASPPLRIALFNGDGRRVDGRIATASDLNIPPGAKRRFAVAIFDPPLGATNLEVGFAVGPGSKGPLCSMSQSRPMVVVNGTNRTPKRWPSACHVPSNSTMLSA